MDESDAAFDRLRDLEQALVGVRGRLADLALLADGHAPPGAPAVQPEPEVLPSADALCGQDLPEPLVLPSSVDAPSVVVPDAGTTAPVPSAPLREDAVSVR